MQNLLIFLRKWHWW